MQIVNPTYCTAFQYLLSDKTVAKDVLSPILSINIVDFKFEKKEEEIVFDAQKKYLWENFEGIVLTDENKVTAILVELQKFNFKYNVFRTRNSTYDVASRANYMGKIFPSAVNKNVPVIGILLLGFEIEKDVPVIKTYNRLTGVPSGKEIESDSFFECLFPSHLIIQTTQTPKKKYVTDDLIPLRNICSLFDQNSEVPGSDNLLLEVAEVPSDEKLNNAIHYLHQPTKDADFMKSMKKDRDKLIAISELAGPA